jgi:hypothetical protein
MNDDIRDPDAPSDAVWLPIRASLRDVAVPVDAREDAIAAALAEFDALQATPAAAAAAVAVAGPAATPVSSTATEVVSLADRRQRRYRWLPSAAAAMVVLAGVGIVAGTIGRSSNDTANVAVEPASATADDDDPQGGAVAGGLPEAAPKAAAETGLMTATAETLAPGGVDTLAATESTAAAAAESTTPPTIGSIDGAANPGNTTPVDSPDQLVEYAATVPAASRQAPTNACLPPEVEVLGEVVYRQQQAIVVRAPTGQISAIDRLTCAVLVTVDP